MGDRGRVGRAFPVLTSGLREYANVPRSVPWAWVERFAAQAEVNHYQTLEQLAERGGLSPVELWAVVHGKPWSIGNASTTPADAAAWLNATPWEDDEITRLRAEWPTLDCPLGHSMLWLGVCYWICMRCRGGKGTIWVETMRPFVATALGWYS